MWEGGIEEGEWGEIIRWWFLNVGIKRKIELGKKRKEDILKNEEEGMKFKKIEKRIDVEGEGKRKRIIVEDEEIIVKGEE